MRITITVKNLEAVERKLANMERTDYIKPVITEAARNLQNAMRRYPPKPPQSTYDRTGKLGQSWTREVMRGGRGGGWVAQIGTRLKYAPYVQDETRQAEVHQGRWQTIQSVAKDKRDELLRFVVRAIRGWLARG